MILRLEHIKNVKGVGIVVIQDGQILLGKRVDTGTWGLAGGSIEEGETPKEAAIRELYEEFGIVVDDLTHYGVSFAPANPFKAKDYTDGCSIDYFVEFGAMVNVNVKLEPKEMSKYKWVPRYRILSEELYPSSYYSLKTYLRTITG